MIYVIDPHSQRAWNSKLRGFLEHLNGLCGVFLTREKDLREFDAWSKATSFDAQKVIVDLEKLTQADALLLDCRAKLTQRQLEELENSSLKVIVSANHFFLPEKKVLELIKRAAFSSRLAILVENSASVSHVLECWEICDFEPQIFVIPPILDCRRDLERFSLSYGTLEQAERLKRRRILHAGVIMYHRPRERWWQKKFGVLEYYPARTLIHTNAQELDITNLSKVVEDNSRRDQLGNKIRRRLEIILGIQKKRYDAYYSIDLPREFARHLFFMCPEDIFEVVPQIGFQAMRSGMILIGSSAEAYETLGFTDGVNYLSVGDSWSLASLEKVIEKTKTLELHEIESMFEGSQLLLRKIQASASSTLGELWQRPE